MAVIRDEDMGTRIIGVDVSDETSCERLTLKGFEEEGQILFYQLLFFSIRFLVSFDSLKQIEYMILTHTDKCI